MLEWTGQGPSKFAFAAEGIEPTHLMSFGLKSTPLTARPNSLGKTAKLANLRLESALSAIAAFRSYQT